MIPPLHMGEVYTEVSNEDWAHTVWAVAELHRDVIGLVGASRRDIAPNEEPLLLPRLHLEAEGIGV